MRLMKRTLILLTVLLLAGCGDDDDSKNDDMSDGVTDGVTDMAGDMEDDTADVEDDGDAEEDGDAADMTEEPLDPETAPRVMVDRFSDDAGTLFRRSANANLPEADAAIDFDQAPFITRGLSPDGTSIQYYNFDVQPTTPAPIYVLFRDGEDTPVDGQLNIVGVVPGDAGYNDFWRVNRVTVPADYVANTVTSVAEVSDKGFDVQETDTLVNCPVVPDGSTATLRGGDESTDLTMGWYEDQVVFYFSFEEAPLMAAGGMVPTSPIYVTFNINPGDPDGGPASGFVTEMDSDQTHNVVATVPGDAGYSPLWLVSVYDNADFDTVSDLASAMDANRLADGVATPNCPVVDLGQ